MNDNIQDRLYVGLMSGTSMDAVDSLLAAFSDNGQPTVLGWHSHSIPESLRHDLNTLSTPIGDSLDLLGRADLQLGELFADATLALLETCSTSPQDVTAIGSHGQTVRHRPPDKQQNHPFTIQIADPNTIAARTGITTVADFRRADMAAGGQGAPLAPAFHKHVFGHHSQNRVIVNIGGIANITWLPAQGEVIGFDTGPANRLLDYWSLRHLNMPFDDKGQWAAQNTSNPALLKLLKRHPFFTKQAPKSTGREAFNEQWLNKQLSTYEQVLTPGEVQSTLLDLTVETIADAITHLPGITHDVYICGGGAFNVELMKRLGQVLTPIAVTSTIDVGIDPDQVEALAFAWLAQRTLAGQSGNLPAVTGASKEVILGGIYPGNS